LGRSLALQLAVQQGAKVTVVARGKQDLDDVVADIVAGGGVGFAVPCDVTDATASEAAVRAAVDKFGSVDALFCCAGQALTGRFVDRTVADFSAQLQLNYMGAVHFLKIVVPDMMARKSGRVVLCASQAAFMSCVGYAAYSPSKYALRGLGDALRNELLPYDVAVHVLFPGNMNTPGFEIEQLTKPAEALQTPDAVAAASLDSLRKGEYQVYGGNLSGYLMGRMAQGVAPRSSVFTDIITAPFLVVIGWGIRVFVLDKAATRAR